jgi:murein DD-endopeptidase MepM/ murein hydrolase activator NlpD
MTAPKTGGRKPSGLKAKLFHIFRDREIILRSEGQVRYLHLRRAPQMAMAGAVGATLLWLAGVNGAVWLQHRHIETKQAEIAEARVAYERLHGELGAYQRRIAALATDILAGETGGDRNAVDLEELAKVTAGIEDAFARIHRDLDLTEADRRRIIQSRDALHTQIAALEESLAGAEDRILALQDDVAARDTALALERAEIAALQDSRAEWRDRAEELGTGLVNARDRISELELELDSTATALLQERTRVETLSDVRSRLAQQVDRLQDGLRQAELRGERLSINVARLTENMKLLERERVAVAAERETLAADLETVETELNLHKTATDRSRMRLANVVHQLAHLTDSALPMNDAELNALHALETQIGDLAAELRAARSNASDMETAIGEVVLGLSRIAGDSPERLAAVEAPAEKVTLTRELLDAVASVQTEQSALIKRLTEEADTSIARHEAVLRMAGLDVDRLLRVAGFEIGTGGPLERIQEASLPREPDFADLNSGQSLLADDVAVLESRLHRMSALNEVMRCVPLISPVDNFQMTSPFGPRRDPITGQSAMHYGIDIGGWSGIPVHAGAPGTVSYAGRKSGYGYIVEIDHGCGIKSRYAHLKRIDVEKGDGVAHRAVIGKLGSTGRSTGPHVHYEILVDGEPMDPEAFIEAGRYVHKI